MWKLTEELAEIMKDYPIRSQESVEMWNVLIPVKLFDCCGSITWWLSEYDPEHKIAFGYVTGFHEDEWGSVSLDELETLRFWPMNRIERDLFFKPTHFKDLPFNKKTS